jgi:hypothetical protein
VHCGVICAILSEESRFLRTPVLVVAIKHYAVNKNILLMIKEKKKKGNVFGLATFFFFFIARSVRRMCVREK